jgi:hypothetical protein
MPSSAPTALDEAVRGQIDVALTACFKLTELLERIRREKLPLQAENIGAFVLYWNAMRLIDELKPLREREDTALLTKAETEQQSVN